MKFPRGNRALRARNRVELEAMAEDFREMLSYSLVEKIDPVDLLDRLTDLVVDVDGQVFEIDYALVKDEDFTVGREAETGPELDRDVFLISIRESVFSNAIAGGGRACRPLFTFLHEGGHIALHAADMLREDSTSSGARKLGRATSHQFFEDTEWQADYFASAVMAPLRALSVLERQLGRPLREGDLRLRFGMSQPAEQIRLRTYSELRSDYVSQKEKPRR